MSFADLLLWVSTIVGLLKRTEYNNCRNKAFRRTANGYTKVIRWLVLPGDGYMRVLDRIRLGGPTTPQRW